MAINPHKRRVQKQRQRKPRIVRSTHTISQHKKRNNPFQQTNSSHVSYRKKIELILFLVALIGMIYMLFYHSFFRIKYIDIQGTDRINQMELHDAIVGIMNYRIWFAFPGNNYYLVNIEEIHDILLQRYPIDTINISKSFPETLHIEIQEKISTLIYDDGEMYSYVGLSGTQIELIRKVGEDEWKEVAIPQEKAVIAPTTTSTINEDTTASTTPQEITTTRVHTPSVLQLQQEVGEYPIVYHKKTSEPLLAEIIDDTEEPGRAATFEQRHDALLPPETVSAVISWFTKLQEMGIDFSYVQIEDSFVNQGTIYTSEGWKLFVLFDDIEAQMERLGYILSEHVTRPHVSYIDVRYENRVYWR